MPVARSRQLQLHGIKAVDSFQDQCISGLLNYLQADCLRRRDAVSNNAEMHGPKLAGDGFRPSHLKQFNG